jgi:glycosyltransferase involved in cell wall biosynthesis
MGSRPLISVIMIFFNAEKFIREAAESVFKQSYEEWELLLVDDGSEDGSREIALEYARRQPQKVRYLAHPGGENRGMSASRNLGVAQARGEYVAFLDADDVWLEGKLEEQEAVLRREPEAGMVYGATQYWYSWTGLPEDRGRDQLIEHGVEADRVIEGQALLIHFLRGETAVPCPSDILVRRRALDECGGSEESFRYIFTDQALYGKLCLRTPVYVSSRCWFRYRRHQESSVSRVKKRGQLRKARLQYLTWLEGYVAGQGLRGGAVWRAVKQAQWSCRHPNLARFAQDARYRARVGEEVVKTIARRSLPDSLYRSVRERWRGWPGPTPAGKRRGQK